MKRLFKLGLIFTLLSALIALSGCAYDFFLEEKKIRDENFIYEQLQDGTYAIVGLTMEGKIQNELYFPETYYDGENVYPISKIENVFKRNSYLKKIRISNANFDCSYLKECKNLICIQVDTYFITNPEDFFKDCENLNIYVVGEESDYSGYEFYQKNNVYHHSAPKISKLDNFSSKSKLYQTLPVLLGVITFVIVIILSVINFVKDKRWFDPTTIILTGIFFIYNVYALLNYFAGLYIQSQWLVGLCIALPAICMGYYANYSFTKGEGIIKALTIISSVLALIYLFLGGGQGFAVYIAITLALILVLGYVVYDAVASDLVTVLFVFCSVLLSVVMPALLHEFVAFVLSNKVAFWITLITLAIALIIIFTVRPWEFVGGGYSSGSSGSYSGNSSGGYSSGSSGSYSGNSSSGYSNSSSYEEDEEDTGPHKIPMESTGFFSWFFGMSDYSLPYGHWDLGPNIKQKGYVITISGTVDLGDVLDAHEASRQSNRCDEEIMETATKKIRDYCAENNIPCDYTIETHIDYKYEY